MSREGVLFVGLLLSGLGYAALARYVWRHRTAAGSCGLLGILLAVFVWTTFYALELSSRTVASAEIWAIFKYVGVVGMPPCLLAFAVEYTGCRSLSGRVLALLAVVPTLTIGSFVVPATRDLIHVYDPAQRLAGELAAAPIPQIGPLFWPHALYNYGIAFYALILTVVRLFRAGPAYQLQGFVVAVAALVPLVANIAYAFGLLGPDAKDPVPFLFTLLAVVLVWGFFRQELLDVVPVARDVVLEQMVDGVVVLDVHDRIIDANPAAGALLGPRSTDLIGRALPDLHPATAPLLSGLGPRHAGSVRGDLRLSTRDDEAVRDVAVTVTPFVVQGRTSGSVVLLHDVTERQMAQRRLRELLAEQTRVADTLRASLRPLSLPTVPGLQMAARSLPADSGSHVSGDFYDVHRVLGGDWAFAVGDVSGKGVEAAVVTTMVRYTVRTLSAEGRSPCQVLEQLNRALLSDGASERFCTLAYGRIDGADLLRLGGMGGIEGLAASAGAREGAVRRDRGGPVRGEAGVAITLALGGHPRPLLRSRSGLVRAVGRTGTVLGLLPTVEVAEVRVVLNPGDVLLLYTDGVTEARRGKEQFGEERLAEVLAASAVGLRGRTGITAAHLVAEAVAERVLAEVTAWVSCHDDVAVLVVAVP
jgi:PAS domain S-box-containing protein